MNRTELTKYFLNNYYLILDTYNTCLDLISFNEDVRISLYEDKIDIIITHKESKDTTLSVDYENINEYKLEKILDLLAIY